MLAGLHCFIEVLLKFARLIADETEDVMQREPLDVGGIFGKVGAQSIEFGQDRLNPNDGLFGGHFWGVSPAKDSSRLVRVVVYVRMRSVNVDVRRGLKSSEAVREPQTNDECERESDAIVTVKLELREKIARRDADEHAR